MAKFTVETFLDTVETLAANSVELDVVGMDTTNWYVDGSVLIVEGWKTYGEREHQRIVFHRNQNQESERGLFVMAEIRGYFA